MNNDEKQYASPESPTISLALHTVASIVGKDKGNENCRYHIMHYVASQPCPVDAPDIIKRLGYPTNTVYQALRDFTNVGLINTSAGDLRTYKCTELGDLVLRVVGQIESKVAERRIKGLEQELAKLKGRVYSGNSDR